MKTSQLNAAPLAARTLGSLTVREWCALQLTLSATLPSRMRNSLSDVADASLVDADRIAAEVQAALVRERAKDLIDEAETRIGLGPAAAPVDDGPVFVPDPQ